MQSKLIPVCVLTFMSFNLIAQMNISTSFRQDGVWDSEQEKWTIFSTDEDELTFFEFNEELTMFKHTTASITSAYMIKSSKHDEERDQYELDIVSDVGNKYLMIIDINNNNVRFIYEKDGALYMVHHRIKKLWLEEDDD